MRLISIVGVLCLVSSVQTGCGKKDEDKGNKSNDTAKSDKTDKGKADKGKSGGDGPLSVASRTLEMGGYTVVMDLPTGWKEQKFGGGMLFSKPGKGLYPSTLTVGPTCEGNCASLADNFKGAADAQIKMHAGYYPTAKKITDGPAASGGHEFQLDLAQKTGQKATQYKLMHWKEGWDQAIGCNAMLLGNDGKLLDKMKAACNSMKVTKK